MASFLRSMGSTGATGTHLDAAGRAKLRTLRELPKSAHATSLAVTAYPSTRRERKAVFNHIELFKYAEILANRLRETGVRPGTVCAFALPNCTEAFVYFFALQWIGAVAAPLEPGLGVEKLVEALEAVGAQTLCTRYDSDDVEGMGVAEKAAESVGGGIPNWHVYRTTNEGIVLETNSMVMAGGAAWAGGAGDFKLDPDEISVRLVAGGTDGAPLDVVPLKHRAMSSAAVSFATTYGIGAGMSTVLVPGLWEAHGLLVLCTVFYSGGHIVLPPGSGVKKPFEASAFWGLASTHKVNWISAGPDEVLDLYESRSGAGRDFVELDFVRSAGGAIQGDLVDTVSDSLGCPVLESYGSAECAGFATSNRATDARLGTAGKAVEGVDVTVFDYDTRMPVQSGVEGDVAVRGEHVTEGYVSGGEATRMATYVDEDGHSWFATGDRGLIDDDGYVSVKGDSRELRAAELAAIAERDLKEKEAKAAKDAEDAEKEKAAAAAAAAASAAAAAAAASRAAALEKAGVDTTGLDDETADAILRRLEAIEANQARLASDLAMKNEAELEDLRQRLEEAEIAADRAAESGGSLAPVDAGPVMLDVRMDELEAAVMAAAASAENSANNTRQALQAAKDVAETTHGSNQSREVAIASTTGDQGALTKTVRVALDDVETALRSHPAVEHARAFGRKDKRYGAEVFCAIVPKRGARVSEPWLKLHAQSLLPITFVPKKFYYLDELPDGMSRRELSESPLLKDLSAFAGYTEVKGHVRGPQYRNGPDGRPQASGKERAPRPLYA